MVASKEFLEVVADLAESHIEFKVHYPTAEAAVVTIQAPALTNDQLGILHRLGASHDGDGIFRLIANLVG